MDMFAIAARLRRRPWGTWIGCCLLLLDGLIIPVWASWLFAYVGGGPATVGILGTVLPAWVCLSLGPMAILSVAGVVALALARNERGFRVASTVAVAWIAFTGLAWMTAGMPVELFIGRVVILAILLSGRMARPRTIVTL